MADAIVTGVPESEASRKLREEEERKAALAASQNAPKPGQVVLSEQDYQAALTKAKEDARKEEKEKLYNRIKRADSLEKANAQLKEQVGSLEKKLAEIDAKISQQPAPQPEPIKSVEQIPDNILKVVVETATANLQKQVSELSNMLKTEQESKRQTSLQLLRDQLIKDASGKIIEALVTGNSEEELRANAEKARQEYDNLVARIAPVAPPAVPAPPTAAPTTPPSAPVQPVGPMAAPQSVPSSAVPAATTQETEFTKEVGNMSPAEYTKNRATVLKRLHELYPPGQTNPLMR